MPSLLVVVSLLGLALLAADRLLLAAESRGLVYYRRSGDRRGSLDTALLTILSVYEPGHEHVAEEREREDADEAEDDEPFGLPPAPPAGRTRD